MVEVCGKIVRHRRGNSRASLLLKRHQAWHGVGKPTQLFQFLVVKVDVYEKS
jgi:hypothetical protein